MATYEDNIMDVVTDTDEHTSRPQQWKVVILNDDFTPMEFVMAVLRQYFNKSIDEAHVITQAIHTKGVGIAGIYTYEIAETKIGLISQAALQNEVPLRAIIEMVE